MKLFPTPILALSALLVACPAPPDGARGEGVPPGGQGGPGPQGAPLHGSADPGGDANPTPPPADGTEGEQKEVEDVGPPVKGHVEDFTASQSGSPEAVQDGALFVLPPVRKQEDIQGGAHFSLSGTVSGDCSGKLRIDVLSKTPVSGEAGKVGPLTALEMSAPGAFEIVVPEGDNVELSAICDADGDDKVGPGDWLSAPLSAAGLKTTQSGIELALEPLSGVPNPEEGGKEQD